MTDVYILAMILIIIHLGFILLIQTYIRRKLINVYNRMLEMEMRIGSLINATYYGDIQEELSDLDEIRTFKQEGNVVYLQQEE